LKQYAELLSAQPAAAVKVLIFAKSNDECREAHFRFCAPAVTVAGPKKLTTGVT
jgi:hypothetical protein